MFFKSKKDKVANSIPEIDDVPSKAVSKATSEKLEPSKTSVAGASEASGSAAPSAPTMDLSQGAAMSKRFAAALGEVVAVLMRSEHHLGMSLNDVKNHALPGVALGQFSIAEAQSKTNGATTPVGFVLWANVSEEIDKRLASLGGPLSANEWNSGSIPWVMLAVGDQRLVGALLDKLMKQHWVGKKVKMRIKSADGKVSVSELEQRPAAAMN